MTNRKLTENEKVDISRRYGLMALGYAAAGVAATGLMPNLGKYVVGQAHASTTAKHSLRFGTLISEKADSFLESGVYHLATAIQEKSDGEIAIQLIDKGQACAENTCAQKVANGVLDMGTASSTN